MLVMTARSGIEQRENEDDVDSRYLFECSLASDKRGLIEALNPRQ